MTELYESIPAAVLREIEGRKVVEAGCATGPSFMFFRRQVYDPPASVEEGCAWIAKTMKCFKKASLKLDDLTLLWWNSPTFFDCHDLTPHPGPNVPVCMVGTVPGLRLEPTGELPKKGRVAIRVIDNAERRASVIQADIRRANKKTRGTTP